MANQNFTETGPSAEIAITEDRPRQTIPNLLQENHRAGAVGEKRKVELEPVAMPATNKVSRVNRELVALWLFIAAMIIVSLLAGYQFWAKLSFRSP